MTMPWNKWNKYWKMCNYINMLANHVYLLQFSWWRHSLSGGNSDSLTAECVILWSSVGWRSAGFQGLFTGSHHHAVDLNGTEFKKQKKTWFCWKHTHMTQFFDSTDHFSCVSSLNVPHFQVVVQYRLHEKDQGRGYTFFTTGVSLGILVFYKWAQCRTIASVCQCWGAHISAARFNAMQNKQNKKQQ